MDTTKIARYMWNGQRDRLYYEGCETTIVNIFGEEKKRLVTLILAATSIRTDMKSNITIFKKALRDYENNSQFEGYLPNVRKNLNHIKQGLPLSGRKITNFANALSGDKSAVVVDTWILRAFGYSRERVGGANPNQYNKIEAFIKQEAPMCGLDPRQMTAMIWTGIRTEETGKIETSYTNGLNNSFINLFFDGYKNERDFTAR